MVRKKVSRFFLDTNNKKIIDSKNLFINTILGNRLKIMPVLFLFFLVILNQSILGQITDQELGASGDFRFRAGLYDFSDEGAVNIKVSVWGYVARPGKYIIPDYATVSDLLSFAGGPNQNAEMDDLRIYRTLENGTEEMIKFNYDDVMWGQTINVKDRFVPKLEPSDVMIVPGSPRFFFKDWFNMGLQIFSALISVISLYIIILRYN